MTFAANTATADDPKSPTADEVKSAQERLGDYLKGIEGAAAMGAAITANGTVTVDPKNGDKGDIKATLTFKDGVLTTAETKVSLTPGMRPRCQATKLLDPDPIVRGMAEDSIRMMGTTA